MSVYPQIMQPMETLMLIIDAHLDLSWNALQWNRDLLQSVYTIRTQEVGVAGKGRTLNTVALPEMKKGKIAVCLATLLARSTGRLIANIDYGSAIQANGVAWGQLAYYQALASEGHIRIIADQSALDKHISDWEVWDSNGGLDTTQAPPLGFVISMESADPILQPSDLEQWYAAGLRFLGPAHYGQGRYVGGTGVESGFTSMGFELLDEMQRVGVTLDATHLSDKAFWEAIEHYDGLMIASHNNCRALVPHQRQFSDKQLAKIIERGGVVGVAFDAWMLKTGWVQGVSTNEDVTLSTIVDHIDHICQLTGNTNHVGIGSDLDGGFGREQSPVDLDTITDLQKLPALLSEHGYSQVDIEAIMHGNWLRVLRKVI